MRSWVCRHTCVGRLVRHIDCSPPIPRIPVFGSSPFTRVVRSTQRESASAIVRSRFARGTRWCGSGLVRTLRPIDCFRVSDGKSGCAQRRASPRVPVGEILGSSGAVLLRIGANAGCRRGCWRRSLAAVPTSECGRRSAVGSPSRILERHRRRAQRARRRENFARVTPPALRAHDVCLCTGHRTRRHAVAARHLRGRVRPVRRRQRGHCELPPAHRQCGESHARCAGFSTVVRRIGDSSLRSASDLAGSHEPHRLTSPRLSPYFSALKSLGRTCTWNTRPGKRSSG